MKTKLFYALALAATMFTNILSANVIENVFDLAGTTVKISTAEKSIIVNLGSVQKEVISIVIADADKNILVSETVKDNPNFVKRYNMSKLESGKYTLTVTKKTVRTVQPFEITAKNLVISTLDKKEKFLPVVSINKGKLDVNVLLGNYSNIKVTILDNEGHIVTEDKNYVVLDLHKRYNLSQLPNGIYVIEVMAEDETFYQTVEK